MNLRRRRRSCLVTRNHLADIAFDNRREIEFSKDTAYVVVDGIQFYATLPVAEGAS